MSPHHPPPRRGGVDHGQRPAASVVYAFGMPNSSAPPATSSTPRAASAFAVPRKLAPDLARVLAYWEGLKRGQADMPFWDDVKLTDLPDLRDRLGLVDVFEGPQRFRFGVVGDGLPPGLGGRFLDEVPPEAPLDYLLAQCSATVEAARPTWFAAADGAGRLALPLWGEGQIRMLLIAFG